MNDSPDEGDPEAGAAGACSQAANVPEITVRAADAILGPAIFKKAEEDSVRRVPPLFERLLGYGPHAVLAASLSGFGLATGLYFSDGQLPFYATKPRADQTVLLQESVERTEMLRSVQKMAEEIRILKASVGATHATQRLSPKDASAWEGLKTRLDAERTETGAAIAALAGKVEHLQSESAAKLSQVTERFDRIEQQIAALRAAAASASGVAPARKEAHGYRHDAFDPSQNPTAPGAPRPLGSLAPAASASSTGDNVYGPRTN
jgi:hypothetical protein